MMMKTNVVLIIFTLLLSPLLAGLAAAQSPPAQSVSVKLQLMRANYKAQLSANATVCPTDNIMLRIIRNNQTAPVYMCYRIPATSYPACKVPFDDSVQVCVYTPRAPEGQFGPNDKSSPEATVNDAVALIKENFLLSAELAEVFITVNPREKSLGKYLKRNLEQAGSIRAAPTTLNGVTPLPDGGLLAFTTPEAAWAARISPEEKVLPIGLSGDLKFATLESLIVIRDQFLSARFGSALSASDAQLEQQKSLFLNEIMAKLAVTGYVDQFQPVGGRQADTVGCKDYGSAKIKIVNTQILDLHEAEIALSRKTKRGSDTKTSSILSYWYQVAGVPPYAQPAQPAGEEDDDIASFINQRLLTCQKLPSLSTLPVLSKVAPHFLKEVSASMVRTTTRELHVFHWMRPQSVVEADKVNTTPSSSDPQVTAYLSAHWKKFFFDSNISDMAGNGLYVSLTPSTTVDFGSMAIDLTVPLGTKFIPLLNSPFTATADAITEVTNLGCPLTQINSLAPFFINNGSRYTGCVNIARALVRQLGISMTVYDYSVSDPVAACNDKSVPRWAMVIFDPKLLVPARVSLINYFDASENANFTTEQKMVYEYLRQSRNHAPSASYLSVKSKLITSATPVVPPEEFSKWVNSKILGCGMGKDWSVNWR